MKSNHRRRGPLVLLMAFLAIMLVAPYAGHAAPPATSFEDIDAYITEQMDSARIPGVALSIVQDEATIHARGFGQTSDGNEAVTPDTLFGIGSTGKSITALAVMQLVEAGQINLDEPVQLYIPWFALADAEATSELTVRHLLNMTSGIPATAGGEAFRSTEATTPEDAIRTLRTAEFAHEPGTTFEYVNANYVILGYLVEVVSGQPYGDYVQTNIFDPLEMTSSYTDLERAREAGFDAGHRYWFGRPVAYEMEQLPALVPAGYIVSTAADLSNYLSMYLNDGSFKGQRILSANGIAEMHYGVANATLGPWADGATANYAMGWYASGMWEDSSIVFHPGSEPTFTAMLMIDQDRKIGVVTLMNASTELPFPGAAGALRVLPAGVMHILTGSEPGTVGLGRFYLIFDLIVLVVVAIQVTALGRLTSRTIRGPETRPEHLSALTRVRRVIPLLWEFGLPLAILALPGALGMSWESLLLWTPDLGLTVIVIALIWMLTGLVRVAELSRGRFSRMQLDPEPERSPAAPGLDARTPA